MNDAAGKVTSCYTLKVHTGPGVLDSLADKCEAAGIEILARGTQSIYPRVRVPATSPRGAREEFLKLLRARCGTTFGFTQNGAVQILRRVPNDKGEEGEEKED